MKLSVGIFLTCIFFGPGQIFSQVKTLDKVLTKEKNPLCAIQLKPELVFKIYDEKFKKMFFFQNVISSEIRASCGNNMIIDPTDNDTLVFLNNTFFDIRYKSGCEETVFNTIVEQSFKNTIERFGDFVKPGKIFCLERKRSLLRIISFNSCADAQLFDRIVKVIQKEGGYDKVIAIRCGGDTRDILQF
jgi:hypothetical protein